MYGLIRLLVAAAAFSAAADVYGEQPATASRPSDDFARWIKQLGSPEFDRREEAARALQAAGLPALEALRQATKHSDTEIADQARRLAKRIENGLDALLAEYRDYGLPLPPADAKLVRFEALGESPENRHLGFLLHAGSKTKPARVLVGTESFELPSYMRWEFVEPTAKVVDGIALEWRGWGTFSPNETLAIGLACHARGWKELAEELWRQGIDQETGHPYSRYRQPPGVSRRTALSYLAWNCLANELFRPGADRAAIARRMKKLSAADPESANPTHRELLESLEATLVPFTSQPGTLQRCVDELIDLPSVSPDYGNAPSFRRLEDAGFEAVPTLMKHVGDIRLTRGVDAPMNNSPGGHRYVGRVVVELLYQIGGYEVFQILCLGPDDETTRRAKLLAWWNAARVEGEETYFVRRVLPDREHEQSKHPRGTMLSIIAKRYPHQLGRVYRTVLDERTDIYSGPIAEQIAASSLSDEAKRELFLHAAGNANLDHRRYGLESLAKLDPAEFKAMLLRTIEGLPRTPAEPYWKCPELGIAHVVMKSDDSDIWAMFTKKVKATDVGMRMQFLNALMNVGPDDRVRRHSLDLLAEFLDDRGAPDVAADPDKFDGPDAATSREGLEVRFEAAWAAAYLLKMKDWPNEKWTREQWEELVVRVKQVVAKQ